MENIFWIPVGDAFQKAHLEEWIYMGDDSSSNLGEHFMANIPAMVQGVEYPEPRVRHLLGENRGTIASPNTKVQFYSPKVLSPFPERLELPFPSDEILSG